MPSNICISRLLSSSEVEKYCCLLNSAALGIRTNCSNRTDSESWVRYIDYRTIDKERDVYSNLDSLFKL